MTAIVVAWNAAADLPGCLAALQAQDHPDLEVVVVDNASQDATAQVIRSAIDAAGSGGGVSGTGAGSGGGVSGTGAGSLGSGDGVSEAGGWVSGLGGGVSESGGGVSESGGGEDLGGVVPHPVRAVWNTANRGFCGGVNDALATIAADVQAVLLVNPDAVAAPDLVRLAVGVLVARPEVGTVQPRVLRRMTPGAPVTIDTTGHVLTSARLVNNRGEGQPDRGRYPAGEVFGASGALVLHRRAMLEDVAWRSGSPGQGTPRPEYLTEDLFAYFDDVELDWRARLHGWRAWYEPTAVGVHERGGAGPRRTTRVEALNHTNRLLVLVTCDDARSLLRSAPLVAATSLLKTLELALTVPSALPEALGRLRLLPTAWRRRRQLQQRTRTVPFGEVTARWVEPFRWRPWITAWWTRTRGGS